MYTLFRKYIRHHGENKFILTNKSDAMLLRIVCRIRLWYFWIYKSTPIANSCFTSFSQLYQKSQIMNIQFLFENGKGSVVDEYGRPEPMDYIVDEEQFRLETLSSHTQYLAQLPLESEKGIEAMQVEKKVAKPRGNVKMRETSVKRSYTRYSDQDKVRFFKLLFERCMNAAAAAKQLGIHVRTVQKWIEKYKRDPDSIFE